MSNSMVKWTAPYDTLVFSGSEQTSDKSSSTRIQLEIKEKWKTKPVSGGYDLRDIDG